MTLVRKTAQKISAIVVRYSSAGCKEWAEGLAREVDFIKSDWGAMLWSIGSLRVLLDRRPAPIKTYNDLKPLLSKFNNQTLQRKWMPIIAWGTMSAVIGPELFIFRERIGFSNRDVWPIFLLFIFAVLVVSGTIAIRSFVKWSTIRKGLEDKSLFMLIPYYRVELNRSAHPERRPTWWAAVLMGISTMLYGVMPIHHRIPVYFDVLLIIRVAISVIYTSRNARRRLGELDALLKTKS